MEGYVYTRDNNGTKEAVFVNKNTGKAVALASLSGYLAFSGGIIEEGMKKAGYAAKGTAIGKVYAITDGVISGINAKTKQDLIYIVKNLSVESEGSKTILYSGNDKS